MASDYIALTKSAFNHIISVGLEPATDDNVTLSWTYQICCFNNDPYDDYYIKFRDFITSGTVFLPTGSTIHVLYYND